MMMMMTTMMMTTATTQLLRLPRRMRSHRQRVRRRTVYDWADDFIAALSGTDAGGLAVRKPAAVPSGDSR
jgi:hypothetical protein